MNVKFVSIFNEFLSKTTISMNLRRKRDKIDFSNDLKKKYFGENEFMLSENINIQLHVYYH